MAISDECPQASGSGLPGTFAGASSKPWLPVRRYLAGISVRRVLQRSLLRPLDLEANRMLQ